jgi:hypothetical protein
MPAKKTTAKAAKVAPDVYDVYEQSAVNLLRSDWRLLRKVADARADKAGRGRRSVSAVIAGLIDDRREQLKQEAKSSQ